MSTSHVLSIVEILEQILSHLPPLNIIRCRRVNSTWRQLIDDSPLLQYRAWVHNDCPDPAYRNTAEYCDAGDWAYVDTTEYYTNKYIFDVSRHFHPIVVANIMKNLPADAQFEFERPDQNGFGGHFNLRPVLLRDLMQWYERNNATEHIWGKMPLSRPDARELNWEISDSEEAGIPVRLEAVPVKPEHYSPYIHGYQSRVDKAPGQPLVLTVGDLMKKLDWVWQLWIDSEHENHYFSHDGGVCDYDMGIPGEGCLADQEDSDDDGEWETSGIKLTMEEHIEQAIAKASK